MPTAQAALSWTAVIIYLNSGGYVSVMTRDVDTNETIIYNHDFGGFYVGF